MITSRIVYRFSVFICLLMLCGLFSGCGKTTAKPPGASRAPKITTSPPPPVTIPSELDDPVRLEFQPNTPPIVAPLTPEKLEQRLLQVGIDQLIQECRAAGKDPENKQHKGISEICRALDVSRHILRRFPEVLREQLQARLVNHQQPYLKPFQQFPKNRVTLRAVWPSLEQANGTLIRRSPLPKTAKDVEESGLYSLAITPDGKWLITGASKGRLKIWDVETCQLKRTLSDGIKRDDVHYVAITSDGKTIVSVHGKQGLAVWDFATGTLRKITFTGEESIHRVVVTSDGKTAISSGEHKTVSKQTELNVWDLTTGELQRTIKTGHKNKIDEFTVSPDGKTVASTSGDKTIELWDIATGKSQRVLKNKSDDDGDLDDHRLIKFSLDGKTLISADYGYLSLWDVSTGKRQYRSTSFSGISGLLLSHDGKTLFIGSKVGDWDNQKGAICLWNMATRKLQRTLISGKTRNFSNMLLSPDGKTILTTPLYNRKELTLWNIATGHVNQTRIGYQNEIEGAVISPDSHTVISIANEYSDAFQGVIRIWGTKTKKAATKSASLIYQKENHGKAMLVSPNGQSIITRKSGSDGEGNVWDFATGKHRYRLPQNRKEKRWFEQLVVDPKNRVIVSADGDKFTVSIWDFATGKLQRELHGHSGDVNSVAISPDGKSIISASSDKTLKIWDLATGKLQRTLKEKLGEVGRVLVCPNGKEILSVEHDPLEGEKPLKVWDLATGKLQRSLKAETSNWPEMMFTPDGRQLVISYTWSAKMEIWDFTSGTKTASFNLGKDQQYHRGTTYSSGKIAISPNGRWLAVEIHQQHTATKTKLTIWDMTNGKLMVKLPFYPKVEDVAWGIDGKTVVVLDHAGRIHRFELVNFPTKKPAKKTPQK